MNRQEAVEELKALHKQKAKLDLRFNEITEIINAPEKEMFPPDGEWVLGVDGEYSSILDCVNSPKVQKQGNVFQTKEHAELAATYVKHHLMMFHLWLKVTGGDMDVEQEAFIPIKKLNGNWVVRIIEYIVGIPTYTKEQCQQACDLLNGGILDE